MDKQALRERVWDALEAEGIARFPFPPHGRIPNFDGAREAADRLAETSEWQDATVIKANPDSPQLPVRRRALAEGKLVYMAVPRLRDEQCFVRLDPATIEDTDRAAAISHMDEYGTQVSPDEIDGIGLIVSGSVAVTETGARIGKGEGYSDLEYAILRELGLVDDDTPVVTTVHERQIVDEAVEVGAHDVSMDLIVTPEREIRPEHGRKPAGIDWGLLSADRIEEIPVLQRFR
ncbi:MULTISPECIES: 5-formyltetrahydrofolate cyclo-ligase [unclassified Haladaptatus]|uniref:5-formyltetrahydrofolate cyclo-ligase n=1 Tax=unclassified Haladaptatus TaxID=2622732 RepID=UPI0023E82F5B|nr:MULTISPECIES: 5-formyltetrahydrofolate cyclo-ligase [unclassified Haladaptatus]